MKDPDVWVRHVIKDNVQKHHENTALHADDALVASKKIDIMARR